MRITVEELRTVFDGLLEHLDATGQASFEIDEDYYWEVPREVRYDPYQEVEEATLGQLSDDWAEVRSMLDGGRPLLGFGLVWLASVLRRIGEQSTG